MSVEQPESVVPPRRTHAARPERLLVAEDEHLVAAGIKSSLNELGYFVIGPAPDGEQAIELARTMRPDLALLDIKMPRRNGIEAGEIIFRQFGIPVIIISAYSDPDYLAATNRLQAFGYLLKPVTQDELRVTIEVAWNRYVDFLSQREHIERLKDRLEHRKIIEQAKWLLVRKRGIGEPDAMRLLQQQARNNRRTLVDVASSLIENESLLGG
jgi:response regulator NasT